MMVETPPPIKALFVGIEDLMVNANATQTENKRYAGKEQYQGI